MRGRNLNRKNWVGCFQNGQEKTKIIVHKEWLMDLGTNSLMDTKDKGLSKDGSEVLNLESSKNKKL